MNSTERYLDNSISRRTFLTSSGLLAFSCAFGNIRTADRTSESKPAYLLKPIGRTLMLENYFIWCSSPIWGKDGKVHLFYSRWTKDKGMGGWLRGSEIGHAVAENPYAQFEHREVVVAPRDGFWDSMTCHNPLIKEFNGTYYLYYIGCSNGKTDTKRIGVATSKSLDGPWERSPGPILPVGEEGAWDDHCTTNPAVIKGDDDLYWLYYKSWNTAEYLAQKGVVRGNRKYGLAKSSSPIGPFIKVASNPVIDFSAMPHNAQLEDAFVWKDEEGYKLIARDMGFYNHEYGLLLKSSDGHDWKGPDVAYLNMGAYIEEPAPPSNLKRFGRLERPMLLLENNSGKPQFLFGATQGGPFQTSTTFVFQIIEYNRGTRQNHELATKQTDLEISGELTVDNPQPVVGVVTDDCGGWSQDTTAGRKICRAPYNSKKSE